MSILNSFSIKQSSLGGITKRLALAVVFSCVFFLPQFGQRAEASIDLFDCNAPLDQNDTYVLQNDITGTCTITANVTITNAADYTITGTLGGNGDINVSGQGYNITIDNINLIGGIQSSGADQYGASGYNAGSIVITNGSTVIGDITAVGGTDVDFTSNYGGNGGSVTVSGGSSVNGYINVTGGNGYFGGNGGSIAVAGGSTIGRTGIASGPVAVFGSGAHSAGPGSVGGVSLSNATLTNSSSTVSGITINSSGEHAIPTQISGSWIFKDSSITYDTAVLFPGSINRCGDIFNNGTYNLGTNLTSGGNCLNIYADSVTINGNNNRITGNISVQGIPNLPGVKTTTIQDVVVVGIINSLGYSAGYGSQGVSNGGALNLINASSSAVGSFGGAGYTDSNIFADFAPGAGGNISLVRSTSTSVISQGGSAADPQFTGFMNGGNSGTITIATSTIINLGGSGTQLITAKGGNGDSINNIPGTNGTIFLTSTTFYNSLFSTTTSPVLTSYNTTGTFVAAPYKYVNGVILDSNQFKPGILPRCGELVEAGTYTLQRSDPSGSCQVRFDNVVIQGNGYTVNNITGDGYTNVDENDTTLSPIGKSFSVNNINILGILYSQGGTKYYNGNPVGFNGGSITISSSTVGGNINTEGGNASYLGSGGPYYANAGNVTLNKVTLNGSIIANGVDWQSGEAGGGGNAGNVTVTDSSIDGTILAHGGNGESGFPNGIDGILTLTDNTPVVTLVGSSTINLSVGDTYNELGATSTDIKSGVLTPVVTGTVNTAAAGTYTKTYTATDGGTSVTFNNTPQTAGPNAASTTRTIVVTAVATPPSSGGGSSSGGGGSTFTYSSGGTFTPPNTATSTSNQVALPVPGCPAGFTCTAKPSGTNNASNANNPNAAPTTGITSVIATLKNYPFNRDLKLASRGSDVKALQQLLNALGYIVSQRGLGSKGNESTYFGTATRNALVRFQKANGITPSQGYFGAKTRNFLKTGSI